jgi:transposase
MTDAEAPATVGPVTAIGVDLGIAHVIVTSEGQYFEYSGYYVQAQKQNRVAQKSLC